LSRSNPSPFVRAARRRSRIALYASLALAGCISALAVRFLNRTAAPEQLSYLWAERDLTKEPSVELFRRYVRIDTSQPNADELAGAQFLADELRKAGLTPIVEDLGNRRANLWAILEGESAEAIVLHNHIDTDPLGDLAKWQHHPLSAHVDGPSIWGRGTFDMKSVAIAQLEAVRSLAASGRKPHRSVIFLATGSEEIGSEMGMRRILAQHPDLKARFWAVLTEGGVVETWDTERVKYWGTEIAQRRLVKVRYEGKADEIEAFRKTIRRPYRSQGPFVVPEVREFLSAYAPTRDSAVVRDILADPDRLLREPARLQKLSGIVRSLFFNEAFPEPVREATDGRAYVVVRLLLLPGHETGPALEAMIPAAVTQHLTRTIEEELPGPVPSSPTNHPLFRAIDAVIGAAKPGAPIGPYIVTRSLSDARWLRAAGIPAYGFSPFHVVPSDTLHAGRPNEHFGIVTFLEGVEMYRVLLERVANDASGPTK
jgi:acetylornithine deacetylase/succinyl-diaminopimelate desuccinylase-like protein